MADCMLPTLRLERNRYTETPRNHELSYRSNKEKTPGIFLTSSRLCLVSLSNHNAYPIEKQNKTKEYGDKDLPLVLTERVQLYHILCRMLGISSRPSGNPNR